MPTETESPVAESLDVVLARLQKATSGRTPEDAAKMQAEHDRRRADERVSELTANWNAPKRQLGTRVVVDGDWGKTLNFLAPRLGTGFLVVLHGVHGGGKTQMGVELMRYQVEKRLKSARFTTSMEFFMAVKATYKQDSEKDETKLVEEFSKPGFLVVDEVEKRGASEWENNLLFHMFNRRYNDMKDTLMISNLSATELAGHLGPSLVSRLSETGGMIACNWPSRR